MADTHQRRIADMAPARRGAIRVPTARWAAVMGLVLAAIGFATPVSAQESQEADPRWDSERCLDCHDDSTDTLLLPSGEELSVAVDGEAYRSSAHAATGVDCAHCHTTMSQFPHSEPAFPDVRSFTVELSKSCNLCHWQEAIVAPDQAHALVPVELRSGVPVCTDCHEAHAPMALGLSHPAMQASCDECHSGPEYAEIIEIHAGESTTVDQASPPPLVLFYLLIAAALTLVIAIGWGGVLAIQWGVRRFTR